jgi:hypothetical protein
MKFFLYHDINNKTIKQRTKNKEQRAIYTASRFRHSTRHPGELEEPPSNFSFLNEPNIQIPKPRKKKHNQVKTAMVEALYFIVLPFVDLLTSNDC